MTTAHSPLRVLRAQANQMAKMLKAAERGDPMSGDGYVKLAEARKRDTVKFALVMDDKLITFEMPWADIAKNSEAGISDYILKQMRQKRPGAPTAH